MDNVKKIVILGAGESGTGSGILAKKQGFDVFVSDNGKIKPRYREMLEANNIPWEENRHSERIILGADEIIKSPGIPESTVIIQMIRKKGIKIISEIEFAARYTSAKKYVLQEVIEKLLQHLLYIICSEKPDLMLELHET